MVFGFGKKHRHNKGPQDPLAAYDGLLEDLERQASAIRRSAATLLSFKGELSRDVERYQRKVADIQGRLLEARQRQDPRAERVLGCDLRESSELLEASRGALASAEDDSRLLLEAASDLSTRTGALRAERASARARLSVGVAVSVALRERVDKIDKLLALDAARDEVERAHALAEVYRAERKDK